MVIDNGTEAGEVFIASSDSTMWLRVKNQPIVNYYANYFENLWSQAKKLKLAEKVDIQEIEVLEKKLRGE